MVSERIYDLCRPILDNEELGEESKTDALEELLSSEPSSLKGKALEDAVLGVLWQWKYSSDSKSSPPPPRSTNVIRSRSPAPWIQRAATPISGSNSPRPSASTPSVPPGFGPTPPALARTKSQTVGSPFSSPKPSPRLPLATPIIPHSPRLSAYQFSDSSPNTENYGDYGSDTVDWLLNDDTSSQTSFGDSGFMSSGESMQPYTSDMSPYDMLRSILQDNKTDEELEQILEANGWDLSQTINSLMEAQGVDLAAAAMQQQQKRTYLIGKSMSPSSRPVTPAGQQRSPTVCRYWLASGHCARADCRFAHEVQNHICKYWLQGNCIAGNSCLFSHDPAVLMQQLNIANSGANTPRQLPPNFQLSDFDSFPALQPTTSNPYEEGESVESSSLNSNQAGFAQAPPGLFPTFVPTGPRLGSGPGSRPGSRHNSRAPTPSQQVNFQDDDAFPSLGSAASKPGGKRHHGKRGGHGHHNHGPPVQQPGSLADVVRMSPSPGPNASRDAMRRGLRNNRSFTSTRENSTAAMDIPAPKEIPWLETGDKVNGAYMKARQEAFKHGGLRNKFLQSAAQAWNRNDARGAKALSLRGQNENALMREKHREAARALYEERNKNLATGTGSKELYVDLHGLHPEEAVQYLSDCLREQKTSSRPVYAICGTGHHSKNGKDKVGKAIRQFLNEWRYAFREFSVPGDRNNVGGILGINPASFDRKVTSVSVGGSDSGVSLDDRKDTKIMLVKEDPRKVTAMPLAAAAATADDDEGES
ncbi:Polyadenylate-binding -interacting 7 [Lecanosticta acicola]|uniref:Polyadenylate-binding -interacting 7 n=1 Tax=Lecanosticta acicola TaxID=111012 RepID=A0AAI8Z3M5_9PEZI|nr:Polyadenylate-binding -interacting 7 [Lecanosticta acicola]